MTNLSPDQIPSLTDAELNQACAERVMGWEPMRTDGNFWDSKRHFTIRLDRGDFSPATSLFDAACCTEAMLAKGWRFTAHAGFDENDAPIYCYRLSHYKLGIVSTSKWQPLEPRARAEACLRAAMREEEK